MLDISFADKVMRAYARSCKTLCHTLDIPQTAFDILMFLANNPEYKSARDIVEIRHIKANLVSINVERLVQEGLVERREVAGDRRRVELLLTPKAEPLVAQGRIVQKEFLEKLLQGLDAKTLEVCNAAMQQIEANIAEMDA
ncbi:MAG TPA: MarR family transcriptional regulator [Oribacterium sp.]|nr:MarR family transcriptional regulator [Oribacterium sp.]